MAGLWVWLARLFQRPDPVSPEESAARVAAHVEFLRSHARSCLHLLPAETPGRSQLGGTPSLAADQAWPRDRTGPLGFLAQLNLADVREAGGPEWLPVDGDLLFFFDVEGLDPSAVAVLHAPAGTETAPEPEPPDLSKKQRYKPRAIAFEAATSYPMFERHWHLTRGFTEEEDEAVNDALGHQERASPDHQIGGYPAAIQGDFMEAEAQHDWNRRFAPDQGAASGNNSDLSPPGVEDWLLLLQLDSDDLMGTKWGDGGRLYFWIREQDARAGDFSQVQLIAQSH